MNAAERLGAERIHLPLHIMRERSAFVNKHFRVIGVSCHSPEEAAEAESLGASYITAGHIFDTDCKKGLAGRGLVFLKNVCAAVKIPVYAIGGITPENICSVKEAGADGVCIMSGLMKCSDVKGYIHAFEEGEKNGIQ